MQKNLKKAKSLQQILAKNSFFLFAPERWSTVFLGINAGQNIQQPSGDSVLVLL